MWQQNNIHYQSLNRVGSGHYTAYGSHEDRWYHFNDSTVTLTNEDAVRKAKAYILFYVERAEQVASDDPAATSPATEVTQDTAEGHKDPAGLDLMDTESLHSDTLDAAASENESQGEVGLREADAGSAPAVAHSDTSEEAGVEETSQAIQTVAQWFCQTASKQPVTPFRLHLEFVSHVAWYSYFSLSM